MKTFRVGDKVDVLYSDPMLDFKSRIISVVITKILIRTKRKSEISTYGYCDGPYCPLEIYFCQGEVNKGIEIGFWAEKGDIIRAYSKKQRYDEV